MRLEEMSLSIEDDLERFLNESDNSDEPEEICQS
jgi:predicted component of type VI protein secretion system